MIDTRYYFGRDNPFLNDPIGDKKKKLKEYILAHTDVFNEIDVMYDNRYMILFPETQELFGEGINQGTTDLTGTMFNNKLKEILSEAPIASEDLKEWGRTLDQVQPTMTTSSIVGGSIYKPSAHSTDSSAMPFVPPYTSSQLDLSKVLESGTMYDMYSEKLITYTELRTITINIARSLLDPKSRDDDTLAQLENEERRRLINIVSEFKNVTVISPYIEDDIANMTVSQLKTLIEKCEKAHSRFKVNEVLKSGFNVCSVVYDSLFPDGIPISKTKRIQFGGIGEEFKNRLLDNTKTVGFGFSRFLQKHDINITDEMAILIAMGEVITSKARIVNVAPKKKKSSDDEESSDEEFDEESSDESDATAEPPELEDV